jgi:hypothetical protein
MRLIIVFVNMVALAAVTKEHGTKVMDIAMRADIMHALVAEAKADGPRQEANVLVVDIQYVPTVEAAKTTGMEFIAIVVVMQFVQNVANRSTIMYVMIATFIFALNVENHMENGMIT